MLCVISVSGLVLARSGALVWPLIAVATALLCYRLDLKDAATQLCARTRTYVQREKELSSV
jgi:hypothetical protein